MPPSKEQQLFQKEYLQNITGQALKQALENKDALLFDPQGRVLIDVSTELSVNLFKQGFGDARTPSPITTVSLDLSHHPELKKEYLKQYGLNENQFQQLSDIRDSIIPLQQEIHFHLALAARLLIKSDPGRFPAEQMNQAHLKAMQQVHSLIQNEFKQSLKKATAKERTINDVILIHELDKARKKISLEAHQILAIETAKQTGHKLTRKEFKQFNIKHKAEETTATPNDLIHTNQSLKQMVWISGSEQTAHKRGVNIIAERQIVTVGLLGVQDPPPRLQMRTSSLDVKDNDIDGRKLSKQEKIADVKNKLGSLATKYSIHGVVTKNALDNKAFTYNLHTAINDTIGDLGGNKQSEGARIILSGAHLYNKSQLTSPENAVFCFVQNISVNGFGDTLGYEGNDLKTEATLMAEMAMLHNLGSKNDIDNNQNIQKIFGHYKTFLQRADGSPKKDLFFSKSREGQQAIQSIQNIKATWRVQDIDVSAVDPVEKAKAALKRMMANDLHHQHEYSKLIQSLSLFVEEASISGCKSGNERAQAINGRVAIFDSESTKPDSAIFQTLVKLAKARCFTNVINEAANLKRQLDVTYDKHLQAGVSLISDVDQGASTKINAKVPWYKSILAQFNRNYAEESSLRHLSQEKAGNMQAHKGLTENMAEAWEPKGFREFLGNGAKSIAKFVGLTVLSAGIWALKTGVEYAVYRFSSKSREKVEAALQDYQKDHQSKPRAVEKKHDGIDMPEQHESSFELKRSDSNSAQRREPKPAPIPEIYNTASSNKTQQYRGSMSAGRMKQQDGLTPNGYVPK